MGVYIVEYVTTAGQTFELNHWDEGTMNYLSQYVGRPIQTPLEGATLDFEKCVAMAKTQGAGQTSEVILREGTTVLRRVATDLVTLMLERQAQMVAPSNPQ